MTLSQSFDNDCFTSLHTRHKILHVPTFPLFTTLFTSRRIRSEKLLNLCCLPPLPHPVLSWTLPYLAVSVVQTHPTTLHQPIPFQSLKHQGGGLPVFRERELGHRRGQSQRLSIYIFVISIFQQRPNKRLNQQGKEKEWTWTTMIY